MQVLEHHLSWQSVDKLNVFSLATSTNSTVCCSFHTLKEGSAAKLFFNASPERIPKKSQGANFQGCRMDAVQSQWRVKSMSGDMGTYPITLAIPRITITGKFLTPSHAVP